MEIVDAQRLAGDLDARLKDAVATITRTAGAPLRVVEVAYTDDGFNELYERVFAESMAYAESIGITYEVTKVTNHDRLRAVLTSLSADETVQGILIRGCNLHRGEDWTDPYGAADPAKDIGCRSLQNIHDLLRGYPTVVHPELGAILRVAGHKPPVGIKGKTVALIGGGSAAMDMQSVLPFAAAIYGTGAHVFSCHATLPDLAETARRADIVIWLDGLPRDLDARYVRDGQVIVDLGFPPAAADIAPLRGVAATFADGNCISRLASRQRFVNLVRMRVLTGKPTHSLDLIRQLY